MKDKRLEMLKEIERIKEKEQEQEQAKLANSTDFLENRLSEIESNQMRLARQLNKLENDEASLNIELMNIKNKRLSIKEEIFSSKSDPLREEMLNLTLIDLSNQESKVYETLEIINNQKVLLNDSLDKLNTTEFNISGRLQNQILAQQQQLKEKQYDTDKKTINSNKLTPEDRENFLIDVTRKLFLNKITMGTAIKLLRVTILKMNQEQFAKLVGVSRKTISEIENDRGNLSVETISAIIKPFKLSLTFLPTTSEMREKLVEKL